MIISKTGRVAFLDGIRGLLAATVAINHIIGSLYGWGFRPFNGAYLAVNYFFILSGFVLSLTYRSEIPWIKYICLRLFRLWPLHFITTLGMFLIYAYNKGHGRYVPDFNIFDLKIFLLNVGFMHGILPSNFPLFNDPSWSISIEFWLSIMLIPVLIRFNTVGKFILFFTSYMYFLIFNAGGVGNIDHYFGLLSGISGISLGAFMYDVRNRGFSLYSVMKPSHANYMIYSAFIFVLVGIYSQDHNRLDFLYIVAFIPLMLIEDSDLYPNLLSRLLSSAPLQWMGYISFSLYLIHSSVIVSGISSPHGHFLSLVIEMTAAIFLSTVTCELFEQPSYRFLKARLNLGRIR